MLFSRLIDVGADTQLSANLHSKIRITNFIAVFYAMLAVFFLLFTAILYPNLTWVPLLFILSGILAVWLNRLGIIQGSRFVVCFVFNTIYTLYHASLLPKGHFFIAPLYAIQIIFWITPWLVYDFTEKPYLFFYTTYGLITTFSLPFLNQLLSLNLDISLMRDGPLGNLLYVISMLAITGGLYFLKVQSHRFEQKNELLLREIKQKNTDLESQNEEIKQQQEEIITQRDIVAEQNQQLHQAQDFISRHNEELHYHNEQLERNIRIRTDELSQAYHDLMQYNHQLEEFAYITAHNLRSPVARLLGLASLLELNYTADENENKFVLSKMVETTQDLDSIIHDLNMILEIRKAPGFTPVLLDLEMIFEKVCHKLSEEIADSQALVNTDFSQVPVIKSSPIYVENILFQLLSNAIKYKSPDRQPHILVTSYQLLNGVRLAVSDNGLGIDLPRFKGKLFGLYKRFHDHVPGKGLGLFLVKLQVSVLKGSIEVISQPGEGSTFYIDLDKNHLP